MSTPAFATGSHVYGTPRPDSDLDLVILVEADPETLHLLAEAADATVPEESDAGEPDGKSAADERPSFRFGKLNLIVVRDVAEWIGWRRGTSELVLRRPVAREEAVRHLEARCGAAAEEAF